MSKGSSQHKHKARLVSAEQVLSGSIPSHKIQYHRCMVGGIGFTIACLRGSLHACANMARAACVRRLPSLPSNSLMRTVCEQPLHVRVTPLLLPETLLIVCIMPRIPAAFFNRCDRNHSPVTLVPEEGRTEPFWESSDGEQKGSVRGRLSNVL